MHLCTKFIIEIEALEVWPGEASQPFPSQELLKGVQESM